MQTRSTYYPSPPPPSTRTRALGTTTIVTTSANTSRAIQFTTTTARHRHLQVKFVEPVKSPKTSKKKKAIATSTNASTVRKVVKSVVRVGKKLDTQNRLVKKPRSVRRVKGSGKNTISA